MILLDSDIVTLIAYGNENVQRKIDRSGPEYPRITIVTRFEILDGRWDSILKAANEDELRKAVERYQTSVEFISRFRIEDIDDAAIAHFGRLRKQKNLKKIGRPDLLIACIALARNALLVTRNTKDYRDITGLRTENWVD